MNREFVERRESGFYIVESRVPLDHVVREYQEGEPPEAIRSHYPTLSLEQVYGAIAFYLGNRTEVERAMAERECEEDAYSEANPAPAYLKEKLDRMRRQLPAQRN
jgi:uncharacterized protein (DUF433 family)